ncbi:MAG: D-alanyl-D-alanine carboxypeptidase [Clostridia bacterium]|nr:D-alanyl-D-alanine carboxypeptidase [Clostridia bacterium]
MKKTIKNNILKLFLALLLFFLIANFSFVNFVYGDTNLKIQSNSSAKAMCLLEQKTGRVLYGKNINEPLAMASTTKIFTALTVLENCTNLDQIVNIDDRAVGIEGTSIYLQKGEKLTVKELLFGMLLPSGNDSATALAYYVGKDIPTFCKMMETTAKNAGAKNSSFKNPHGLDENGHFTTAYDLAKVSAKALENKTFQEISQTKSKVISGNELVKNRYLRNKNKLLNTFKGCNGIKTGFTDNAGRCFVSSATRNNMTVVCAVLNCGPMFEECASFMEKSFKEYKNYELIPAYNMLENLPVENGKQPFVKIFSRKCFEYPLTEEEFLHINFQYDLPEQVSAPVSKEQKVGTVKIYFDNQLLFEDDILTADLVKKDSILQNIKDIAKIWK